LILRKKVNKLFFSWNFADFSKYFCAEWINAVTASYTAVHNSAAGFSGDKQVIH